MILHDSSFCHRILPCFFCNPLLYSLCYSFSIFIISILHCMQFIIHILNSFITYILPSFHPTSSLLYLYSRVVGGLVPPLPYRWGICGKGTPADPAQAVVLPCIHPQGPNLSTPAQSTSFLLFFNLYSVYIHSFVPSPLLFYFYPRLVNLTLLSLTFPCSHCKLY